MLGVMLEGLEGFLVVDLISSRLREWRRHSCVHAVSLILDGSSKSYGIPRLSKQISTGRCHLVNRRR